MFASTPSPPWDDTCSGRPTPVAGAGASFFGCNAHFTLPPVVGALPAAVGWGIVWAVRAAWRGGTAQRSPEVGREQYRLR